MTVALALTLIGLLAPAALWAWEAYSWHVTHPEKQDE